MQYVDIAVDTKTSLDRQTFTYSIPPELLPDIKPGILVLVPFHGRKIHGVIISLKHQSIGTLKQKLKPIIKIIDPNPVIDRIHLELAKWMSDYYLTPIGEVIFSMIPPIATRVIKNINYQQIQITKSRDNQISHKNAIAFLCDKKNPNNIYTSYNRMEERERTYLKLIEKSIAKNKSCLVLLPNIEQAKEFQDLLHSSRLSSNNISSNKDIKSVLYHSEMTKTERYTIWNDIRSGKYQVVVATRPTVFAPINNLGLVIIDQPENFGYKEDQSPRYHSVTIAKKLSEITGANLVLGSLVSSIETYYNEQVKKYQKLQSKPTVSKTKISQRIVDLNNQKNKIISWELEESIKTTIENKGKILLFSQRKGEGSSLICQDCEYVFKCNKCNLPYVIISNLKSRISNLQCYRCNTKQPAPQSCSICHGVKLKSYGVGINKIQKEIFRLFPNVKSIAIDVDSENIPEKISDNQIVIATKKITDFSQTRFDLVGVINLDNLLNLPDYKSSENIYLLICNLLYQCKKYFILQTYSPENMLWNFIKQGCSQIFLKNELLNRKSNNFPPFSQLIKLTYQNESEDKCLKETEKIELQITHSMDSGQASYKLQVLGPGPSFISKVRNKYQYQMLVFTNNTKQKNELYKTVTNLSKGWKIDVDPISLL